MQRISNIVVKEATVAGYKIANTKWQLLLMEISTFIVIEFPVSLTYKNYLQNLEQKQQLTFSKLKNAINLKN